MLAPRGRARTDRGLVDFNANSAETLRAVYEGLSHRVVTNKKETELTGVVALAAALLMTLAAGLSMAWFGFRP